MSEQPEPKSTIPRNPALNQVHDSMLAGLSELAEYFGFSKVMGQLYGTLLLTARPLSLDDMMSRLNISKASVSMNVRTLEHMGMVRQVWVPGGNGRRKYYEAETDLWQIITNLISGREMRDIERAIAVIETNRSQLREASQEMSAEEKEMAELYIERMNQMEALFRFAWTIVTMILGQMSEPEEVSSSNGEHD